MEQFNKSLPTPEKYPTNTKHFGVEVVVDIGDLSRTAIFRARNTIIKSMDTNNTNMYIISDMIWDTNET